jgi:hypothetical protein
VRGRTHDWHRPATGSADERYCPDVACGPSRPPEYADAIIGVDDQHPGSGPSAPRFAILNIPDLISFRAMEISGETLDVILSALADQLSSLAD